MQTETKTRKLFELDQLIRNHGHIKHGKTMWMLARNKTIIDPILEDVRKLLKPTDAMHAYEKACVALGREFADTDTEGKPKQHFNPQNGQQQYNVSDRGAYEAARMKLLDAEHSQAKTDGEEISKRSDELLEEPVNVDFYRINLNKIPGFREDEDDDSIFMAKDLPLLIELGIIYEEESPKVVPLKEEAKETPPGEKLASV